MLLESGAICNTDAMLDDHKTPLHIICESPGDHDELLDLISKSSQQARMDAQDVDECTAVVHAVLNSNINCLKSLTAKGLADANKGYTHTLAHI